MPKITEIMKPVTLTADMDVTFGEVVKYFTDEQIGCIPVINEEGRPVAYLTDRDIIKFVAHERPRCFQCGDHFAIEVDEEDIDSKAGNLMSTPIMEIAGKKNMVFAKAEQEIEEIADMFRQESLHIVAVLDGERIVGTVSESDIVRYVLITYCGV